jgi:hypothetical protein
MIKVFKIDLCPSNGRRKDAETEINATVKAMALEEMNIITITYSDPKTINIIYLD